MEPKRIHPSILKLVAVAGGAVAFFTIADNAGFGKPETNPEPIQSEPEAVISNTAGVAVQEYTEHQLRSFLHDRGFRNLSNEPLHQLRRMYLLWHYEPLFIEVSNLTGIKEDVLFAYFIIEATNKGVESDLMQKAYNPGGVKFKGIYTPVYAYDDCYKDGKPVPCAFENPGSFRNAVELWSSVFNAPRYKPCKDLSTDQTCKCLQENGYHTANNWRTRARLAKSYWTYKHNNLPRC